jgi:hypothetical protein
LNDEIQIEKKYKLLKKNQRNKNNILF